MEDKKKEGKIKKFLMEHKFELITIVLGTAFGAGSWFAIKKHERKAIEEALRNACKNPSVSKTIKTPISVKIDEDIFTELAPAIEEAVLNSGIEKAVFERNYDLDGLTHKFVTVNIERIMGD